MSAGRWTEPGDGSQQPGKGNPEPAGLLPGLLPEASASGHTVHSPLLEHLFARNSLQNAPGFSHHLKCSSVLEPLIPIHFPAARAQMLVLDLATCPRRAKRSNSHPLLLFMEICLWHKEPLGQGDILPLKTQLPWSSECVLFQKAEHSI